MQIKFKLSIFNINFLLYLFVCLFISLTGLYAVEKTNKNTLANVKENFIKEGGSVQGASLLEQAINKSKNESLIAKKEISTLRKEIHKVILGENFDEKKYIKIKSKINDVMMKSIKNKDKIIISLLEDLNSNDRQIVGNILKNLFFVDINN